jgi:hypothetical protein
MSRRLAVATLLAVASLLPSNPARAYFEETAVGARGLALGSAGLATISDVSAYYWNPAALTEVRGTEVLLDYAKPFGLDDLNTGAAVVGGRWRGFGWAAAWHHLGVTEVYSEDLFSLAAGHRLAEWSSGHVLAGGATYKLGRAAFQPFRDPGTGSTVDYGSQAKGSLDVGLKWTTPWNVDFAWMGRDLLEPRYEFVLDSGGDLQVTRQEVAAAFRWNRESTITVGWQQQDAGQSSLNAGIEILFYDVFAIRSGISNISRIYESYGSPTELQYNGGFGVFHRGIHVDAAATTNRDLGASYRVTLRVPVGGDGRR